MTGWLSAGWKYRVKLTLDSGDIDAALTNFPVLIYLSSSSGLSTSDLTFIFDELGANSLKLAVTTDDGLTECYVEVVSWDSVGETAELWVKVPSISSSSDTILYLYYDSTHADNSSYVGVTGSTPAETVWDSNFKLVYHMNDNPDTSSVMDSTGNDNDGTKKGVNEPIEASGKIGKAQDNDNDYIQILNSVELNPTDYLTLSFWYKPKTVLFANYRYLFIKIGQYWIEHYKTGQIKFGLDTTDDGGSSKQVISDILPTDDIYYYFTWTYDGANIKLYLNGVYIRQTAETHQIDVDQTKNIILFAFDTAPNYSADSELDEIQFSGGVARSSAWIKASYETQRDSLITYGTVETWETVDLVMGKDWIDYLGKWN